MFSGFGRLWSRIFSSSNDDDDDEQDDLGLEQEEIDEIEDEDASISDAVEALSDDVYSENISLSDAMEQYDDNLSRFDELSSFFGIDIDRLELLSEDKLRFLQEQLDYYKETQDDDEEDGGVVDDGDDVGGGGGGEIDDDLPEVEPDEPDFEGGGFDDSGDDDEIIRWRLELADRYGIDVSLLEELSLEKLAFLEEQLEELDRFADEIDFAMRLSELDANEYVFVAEYNVLDIADALDYIFSNGLEDFVIVFLVGDSIFIYKQVSPH